MSRRIPSSGSEAAVLRLPPPKLDSGHYSLAWCMKMTPPKTLQDISSDKTWTLKEKKNLSAGTLWKSFRLDFFFLQFWNVLQKWDIHIRRKTWRESFPSPLGGSKISRKPETLGNLILKTWQHHCPSSAETVNLGLERPYGYPES